MPVFFVSSNLKYILRWDCLKCSNYEIQDETYQIYFDDNSIVTAVRVGESNIKCKILMRRFLQESNYTVPFSMQYQTVI